MHNAHAAQAIQLNGSRLLGVSAGDIIPAPGANDRGCSMYTTQDAASAAKQGAGGGCKNMAQPHGFTVP